MKVLLDTHTFLWALLDDPKLSSTVRQALSSAGNVVLVSAASFWEITIKYGLGKLTLPADPDPYLRDQRLAAGIDFLPIHETEVCQVHRLPPHHRDPFDRLLVAQAECYDLEIATDDKLISQSTARTFW